MPTPCHNWGAGGATSGASFSWLSLMGSECMSLPPQCFWAGSTESCIGFESRCGVSPMQPEVVYTDCCTRRLNHNDIRVSVAVDGLPTKTSPVLSWKLSSDGSMALSGATTDDKTGEDRTRFRQSLRMMYDEWVALKSKNGVTAWSKVGWMHPAYRFSGCVAAFQTHLR